MLETVESKVATPHVALAAILDPVVQVRAICSQQEWSEWNITQNLTNRWGEINDHYKGSKPLADLMIDTERFARLVDQMWDEATFIVRKDGRYGVLYEVEYCSIESEARLNERDDSNATSDLRPHVEVVASLKASLEKLAPGFPGVKFAIPHEDQICESRPAVWAFVPDGLLSPERRAELGYALLRL